MPGMRQVLIHCEISFLRLSVGLRSEPFLRFAGSRDLLARGFHGGLSFVGRKCRVRPPIVPPRHPFSLRGPGDPQRRNSLAGMGREGGRLGILDYLEAKYTKLRLE